MGENELATEFLPVYRGRCVNPDCGSSGKQRILTEEELQRTYPVTSELPYTPLPPQATHVCDRCGMVYAGYELGFQNYQQNTPDGSTELDIDDIDWEPSRVHETDLRTAATELVEACPADAELDDVIEMVERWIPGFGKSEAEDIIEDSERDDAVHDLAEYM